MGDGMNKIAKAAQKAYQAVEDTVVGTYRNLENGAISTYERVEDFFVDKMFRKDGESIAETKERLKKHN